MAPLVRELGLDDDGTLNDVAEMPRASLGGDVEPSFRAFAIEDGVALTLGVRSRDARALQWCERLMRYCEVHRADLDRKSSEKWGSGQTAAEGLCTIAAVLAEATLATSDYRYVNTALKILDLPLTSNKRALRGASAAGASVHAILATEAAMRRIGDDDAA
jgi:hypothetical protein